MHGGAGKSRAVISHVGKMDLHDHACMLLPPILFTVIPVLDRAAGHLVDIVDFCYCKRNKWRTVMDGGREPCFLLLCLNSIHALRHISVVLTK